MQYTVAAIISMLMAFSIVFQYVESTEVKKIKRTQVVIYVIYVITLLCQFICVDYFYVITPVIAVVAVLMNGYNDIKLALICSVSLSIQGFVISFFDTRVLLYQILISVGILMHPTLMDSLKMFLLKFVSGALYVIMAVLCCDYYFDHELSLIHFGLAFVVYAASVCIFSILGQRLSMTMLTYGKKQYLAFIASDFELLQLFKKEKPLIYRENVLASSFCTYCAREIGAYEPMAAIGGLFYNVGLMEDGDPMENGIRICKEYKFPEQMCDIIREYYVKEEAISSKESAIVYLVSLVMATYERGKKIAEFQQYTVEKIINSVIQNQLFHDQLSKSELSVEELASLRQAMISYVSEHRSKF